MIVAELHGDIQRGIMECLKDSDRDVRKAAVNVLSSLAAHCMWLPSILIQCPQP